MVRLPAEFEPVSHVYVDAPHSKDTWHHVFDQACAEFNYFCESMQSVVHVIDIGKGLWIFTRDSWIRDYGPIFTLPGPDSLQIENFYFNGWGAEIPANEYKVDNEVPADIAGILDIPCRHHHFVLEGGAIDTNGRGTMLVSKNCLCDEKRNPSINPESFEDRLSLAFGAKDIHWITGEIQGDDTGGHIDQLLRFARTDTLINAMPETDHPDHDTRLAIHRQAQSLRQSNGDTYQLITLPCPAPWKFDYPASSPWEHANPWVPMSYTNFLICNGVIFLPTFDDPADEKAIGIMRESLPEFDIMPIPSRYLAVGRGSLHCLTMQQPAIPQKVPG